MSVGNTLQMARLMLQMLAEEYHSSAPAAQHRAKRWACTGRA